MVGAQLVGLALRHSVRAKKASNKTKLLDRLLDMARVKERVVDTSQRTIFGAQLHGKKRNATRR